MTQRRIQTIEQVVSWRLCMGCGACANACSEGAVCLFDVANRGIRPRVDHRKCAKCSECLKVCPGIDISCDKPNGQVFVELEKAWGPVLEIWEGYASDPEIRFRGSSGGAATALALFCLESKLACEVLHTGDRKPQAPLQNVPTMSRTRDELLDCSGSRYAPAAPCAKLDRIKESDGRCVFIGKPCDVAALRKSQEFDTALNGKVCLAIGIFCAGTPTSEGTDALLDAMEIEPEQVEYLRYRGCGWPGMTVAKIRDRDDDIRQMTYQQSWGDILSNHGQLRCRLCPDGTGEMSDISCGDPWCRDNVQGDPGRSLVLARTELGADILQKAMAADYLRLERVSPQVLVASQEALLKRRRHLWGRLATMRAMLMPTPVYRGFNLFGNWLDLSLSEKVRSLMGTFRRIASRRLYRPREPFSEELCPVRCCRYDPWHTVEV